MRFIVDKDLCVACGLCESACPDVFRIGSDGFAEAYSDDADFDTVDEALSGCPVGAISAEDTENYDDDLRDFDLDEEISDFDEEKLTLESDISILHFEADFCGPCKMLNKEVMPKLKKRYPQIKIVDIDVDTHQEEAMKYNVMSVPQLVILQDGEEVDRIIGFVPLEEIEDLIDNI